MFHFSRRLFLGAFSFWMTVIPAMASSSVEVPAVVRTFMGNQSFDLIKDFDVEGDLRGWLIQSGGQKLVVYTTRSGEHLLAGNVFDRQGKNLTAEHLTLIQSKTADEGKDPVLETRSRLDDAAWVRLGARDPQKILWVFADLECSFCQRAHKLFQEHYQDGLQVRYIPVAILGESSFQKARSLFFIEDDGKREEAFESLLMQKSGHRQWISEKTDPVIPSILEDNEALMKHFGLTGTPGILFISEGKFMGFRGVPDAKTLKEILQKAGK